MIHLLENLAVAVAQAVEDEQIHVAKHCLPFQMIV